MKTRLGPPALVLGIALSLDAGACSSSGASGSGALADAGAREGGLDGGGSSDATGAPDAALSEAGADGAGGDAGCGLPRTGLGGACDDCVEVNCEPAWCTCADESLPPGDTEAGIAGDASFDAASADAADDEAAGGGCLGYAQCVVDCVSDDAGSPTDCFQTVCAVAAYPQAEQEAGHAFLDCLVQYCASDCGE